MLCTYLLVLTSFLLRAGCNGTKKKEYSGTLNKFNRTYYDKGLLIHKHKKINAKKILFLKSKKNKLKEMWKNFTKNYFYKYFNLSNRRNNRSNESSIEGWSKLSINNVFNNFTLKDNNEIINEAIINNSTLINEDAFADLLKKNNINIIRYRDINTIIKIINDYYTTTNHLFSNVLKYEVKKVKNKNMLVIYVNELILDENCIKINVYQVDKEKGEKQNLQRSSPGSTKKEVQKSGNKIDNKNSNKSGKGEKIVGHQNSQGNYYKNNSLNRDRSAGKNMNKTSDQKLYQNSDQNASQNCQQNSEQRDNKVLLERKSVINNDVLNYGLKRKDGKSNNKLKQFFEKKMNIKEKCIFMWDEKMYDLLIKSNLFSYVHVKLFFDKVSNKNILEIDLVENKKMIFIPSISKSFTSFLEFCINLTFAYLHSINYADKFRIKFFQNMNYKNNKHSYDFVFINDIVEMEKLKNNYPAYSICGFNINKVYKKEVSNSSLNHFMNIINCSGENNSLAENLQHDISETTEEASSLPFNLNYPLKEKDIYNYLNKNKIFIFFIKKVHDTIFELKMKFKKKMFHKFLYFLKSEEEKHSNNNNGKGIINDKIKKFFILKYINFFKKEKNYVLFNKLYNIYGSKLKLSSSLNAFSTNFFEKSNFSKTFYNIKNKIDLVVYFNTDKRFCVKEYDNMLSRKISEGPTTPNEHRNNEIFRSELLSFFKNVNKGRYCTLNKINNLYLNYSFYFNKNYKINISTFFIKLKNMLSKQNSNEEGVNKKCTNKLYSGEGSAYLAPVYLCKLALHDVHLLLNFELSFKKNLWNYKHRYYYDKSEQKKKEKKRYYYYNIMEVLNINRKNTHNNFTNFSEDIQRIKVYSNNSSLSTTSSTYDINNINLNDAQKEYLNKMKVALNYKLIFPILFHNYFLNLLNIKLYLFFNYNLFDDTPNDPNASSSVSFLSEQNRKATTYNFLKLNYLKNKKKNLSSSYGVGVLLSNVNVFLNFKLNTEKMVPTLILQLNQDSSKFKYLL
ncbi:protein TOC75, putative [Plasmodium malariae]|uniref:Protein TOC75, putative n=1 Tax=Plasmodium malariae TaxID=5858 RepID=A0A1D3TFH0_PLAMA|nr:protein TOC75, putative [Plasmodium malariae]SCP03628.1 protein TOC75, putative [Plasmodium malariae]